MRYNWQPKPTFRYPPPELVEFENGANYYKTHDGRKAARASKVVNEPFDPKKWYEMCGGQKDGAIVSSIINGIGTLTHKRIELYLKNFRAPKWNLWMVNSFFGGIQPLLDNIDNIVVCEQPVYSPTLGIAGTIDCIAEYNGVLSIIDFKTSTKPKEEKDIKSYFMQTTLYARIFEEMTGIKITQIVILMSVQGGQYKEFVKKTYDPIKRDNRTTCNEALDEQLRKFFREANPL